MKKMSFLMYVFILIAGFMRCGERITMPEQPSVATFENDIEPILTGQCLRCHGNNVLIMEWLKNEGIYYDEDRSIWIAAGNPSSRILVRLSPSASNNEMRKFVGSEWNYQMIYKWVVIDSLAL